MKRSEEAGLVERARKGDREAYRQLVEKYQNRAFAIAYDILRSREDAEDVVQESFVKAYISLKKFRGQASFYTWLYRIVYNMSIDFKRRAQRRGGTPVEYEERTVHSDQTASAHQSAGASSPHEEVFRKEQAQQILEVLNQISEEHRTAIMLREIDGLSYDEIAEATGVSKGTVMSRLHYGRKRLQEILRGIAPERFGGDQNGSTDYLNDSDSGVEGLKEALPTNQATS